MVKGDPFKGNPAKGKKNNVSNNVAVYNPIQLSLTYARLITEYEALRNRYKRLVKRARRELKKLRPLFMADNNIQPSDGQESPADPGSDQPPPQPKPSTSKAEEGN